MLQSYNNNLEELTPGDALSILLDGNARFVNGITKNKNLLDRVEETGKQQKPYAAILSCMDSRAPVEILFDQGIGDVFSIRIAGNVVSENVLGSLEYAVGVSGSKLIMVMGHTNCGAIKGACDHVEFGNLTGLLDKIQPAVKSAATEGADNSSKNDSFVEEVTRLNIHNSISSIMKQSEVIRDLVAAEKIKLVGALYCVSKGTVEVLETAD
ncbi:carbonic anhydrase [Taibaiella sp. KBW10]|uniref:carbonic anhydrase family protein n=1 Tax=Taibaiella sp. KBW10 TaxID=2153357 RepID=UPI000F5922D9|nr:carbonic anhydrase family protein [Taibaiella sp. KBW10]RQO31495.1 carbonic anhydrase [Taibaiella sp. KBW10]